jgi:hypothetical protein
MPTISSCAVTSSNITATQTYSNFQGDWSQTGDVQPPAPDLSVILAQGVSTVVISALGLGVSPVPIGGACDVELQIADIFAVVPANAVISSIVSDASCRFSVGGGGANILDQGAQFQAQFGLETQHGNTGVIHITHEYVTGPPVDRSFLTSDLVRKQTYEFSFFCIFNTFDESNIGAALEMSGNLEMALNFAITYTAPPPPAPEQTSLDPAFGTVGGGTLLLLGGSHFVDGATVTIGGIPATLVEFIDTETLRITTPALSAGLHSVVVTNPDAQFCTLPLDFEAVDAPANTLALDQLPIEIVVDARLFTPWPPQPPNPPWFDPPPPPIPPDGCIDFATAVRELASRLGDQAKVHWTDAEIREYLIEALHVFNGLTQYYKNREDFFTVAGQIYYEMPDVIPELRAYTVLDTTIIKVMEYALLEPPTPTAWTGTAMFNLASLTQVIQRRLDRYRWETGQVITPVNIVQVPNFRNGRVALDSILNVRRAAWTAGTPPVSTPLLRDDEWGLNAYGANWQTAVAAGPMNPYAYSVANSPPLTMQLAPPPTAIGRLDLLAVIRADAIAPDVAPQFLKIPADFCWGIKWGALADLLKAPGPANDPIRGQICDLLYNQCVQAANRSGVVLDGYINGQLVRVNSISDLDAYDRQWSTGTGTPVRLGLAGNNLVAVAPVPDDVYTVLLDVVCNIPIPENDEDCYFEGGAQLTQILLDYAQFVAIFKEGPSQAQEATQLLQRFFQGCGITLDIDQALEPVRDGTFGQTRQTERVVPRRMPTVPTDTGSTNSNGS